MILFLMKIHGNWINNEIKIKMAKNYQKATQLLNELLITFMLHL